MAKMQSAQPTRKTLAGAGGGLTFGGAVTTLLLYGLEQLNGEPVPTLVAAAVGIVVTAVSGFATAYFTRPAASDKVVPE